ncbi:PE family protein [Mycobacterium parmense]|uniref:Uncharacterized protein n=1 Tax=Mycobacterium parmense TaxID=185642 RepID=A0A7I7YSX6_9MYCO|nr:PE family protein [Mycobacterium parmense]MCV7351713.1 PE family protein [Mycobacterium parmense]ORW60185.1 PE-PGRS family protein [Mycobacterium parmense]BBZ44820.1 hypothetical protein MPRM_21010 [Mycobacterium parmense]
MSSYVIAAPEAIAAASLDLAGIGEAIKEAAAAWAPSTTRIAPAAGDEVSVAVARFFGSYARQIQALSAQMTLSHAEFVRALSGSGTAYTATEAANVSPLQTLLSGSGVGTGGAAASAAATNGVTGVRVGFSLLEIPVGPFSVFGYQIGPFNFPAPAHWYFPTQANGSVQANGVIYLQHGFGATGWFYQPLAMQLAQQTDSVVVVPTLPSIPLPFGLWLNGTGLQQGVASLFLGSEPALNMSAHQAGLQGTLPLDFIMTGHSAGGGLATIAAGDYIADIGANAASNHLLGVVMFDGVASNSSAFATSIANLQALHIPDYVVAAAPQPWNAFGATTNELISLYPGQFVGVELVNGSHVDSMLGRTPLTDFILQLVTRFSPPGNTAAVYTLSSGWINDIYAGAGPTNPMYGIYGPTGGYLPPGGQQIVLGPATGIVLG